MTVLNKEGVEYSTFVGMETIVCYKCAVPFAIPAQLKQRLIDTGDEFFCPNGHDQHYTRSTVDLLKEKLQKQEQENKQQVERMQQRLNWANQDKELAIRQKSAVKGQMTKLKNRIKNGVCPCCNRTFSNLASHMKSQHPEFDPYHTVE